MTEHCGFSYLCNCCAFIFHLNLISNCLSVRIFPAFRNVLTSIMVLSDVRVPSHLPLLLLSRFPSVAYSSDYLDGRSSHYNQGMLYGVLCKTFRPRIQLALPVMQPTISRLMMFNIRWCRYQVMIRARRSTISPVSRPISNT